MGRESVADLFMALVPVGRVEAVRQEYEVFRTAGGDFVVFSPSHRGASSYHMTLVPAAKVEALEAAMGKGGVTTGSLMKNSKLEQEFGADDRLAMRFDILTGLSILAAMGRAEMKKEGRNLVFTKREPAQTRDLE